jgi:transcriptional regulator with XRE-family HTH domain
MKDLNIKDLRNDKGFSQAELARRIGVSRQTIVNYEKGEVIPESKKELLYNILLDIPVLFVNEKGEEYTPTMKGYTNKVSEIEEEIKIRIETIKILKNQNKDFSHEINMIELLKKQINLIKSGEFNHKNDL